MGAVWVLTGPLAAGKSTVAGLLACHGARILDADAVVHRLLAGDAQLQSDLRELLGEEIFAADGVPDRGRIAERVFGDASLRRALEALLHPRVLADLGREAAAWRQSGSGLLVLEVVLWFQQEDPPFAVDGVILVTAPRELLLARAAARGRLDPEELERRLAAQGDWERWRQRADRVLDTDCSREELEARVKRLHVSLLAEEDPASQ